MKPQITTLAPWFGSNRTLAHSVGDALDGCKWVGVPFAGGMSELVHIKASTIVVGDVHRHVINLANCLRDDSIGVRLSRRLARTPFHPDALELAQDWCRMNMDRPCCNIDEDSAYYYFVAVWMGRSANAGTDREFSGGLPVRWNANGGDSNTRYRSAVKSLVAWRKIMQRCNFAVMDCFDFLERCEDNPDNGIYCDPPFKGAGDKYKHKFTEQQHRDLAKALLRFAKTRVVCRFYDHPLVRELYPESEWEWRRQDGRKQSNAVVSEVSVWRR